MSNVFHNVHRRHTHFPAFGNAAWNIFRCIDGSLDDTFKEANLGGLSQSM